VLHLSIGVCGRAEVGDTSEVPGTNFYGRAAFAHVRLLEINSEDKAPFTPTTTFQTLYLLRQPHFVSCSSSILFSTTVHILWAVQSIANALYDSQKTCAT